MTTQAMEEVRMSTGAARFIQRAGNSRTATQFVPVFAGGILIRMKVGTAAGSLP